MASLIGLVVTLSAGMALGLFGGGGSLLIVPVLIYGFGYSPIEATADSLFIVAVASTIGAALYWRRRPIPVKRVATFGAYSVVTAYAVRAGVVPLLPETLAFTFVEASRDTVLVVAFAIFAGAAGLAMVRQRCCASGPAVAAGWVPLAGIATGALTGLLGAGGGFLVLPALVLLVGLPMEDAVASSLALVSAQSIAGAAGSLTSGSCVDVRLTFVLIVVMIVGVMWGAAVAPLVPPARLRRAFGWLMLVMAVAMTVESLT